MSQHYARLNPLAMAVAAACAEIVGAILIGLPMLGMMGGNGHMPGGYGMMGGFGLFGIAWWLGGALLFALLGAIFAWIYNAVNAAAPQTTGTTGQPKPIS